MIDYVISGAALLIGVYGLYIDRKTRRTLQALKSETQAERQKIEELERLVSQRKRAHTVQE